MAAGNPIYIGKIRHHRKVYSDQHEAIIDSITWKSVQRQLENNRSKNRSRAIASEPSLLAGLLYDDRGHVMSPSHGGKNHNRRYRYYVSQALLRYTEKEAGSVTRIAAHTIEELVTQETLTLLLDETRLLDFTKDQNCTLSQRSAIIERAGQLAAQWEKQSSQQQIDIVTAVLKKVTIGRECINLVFYRAGLLNLLGTAEPTRKNDSDD